MFYCDTRLYGVERWYYERPRGANMRVPDEVLHSVCFLCVKTQSGQDYFIGTGCFVQVPSSRLGMGFCYLVTARHVVEEAKKLGYKQLYVRLNKQGGGSATIQLPDTWVYGENPCADVAALSAAPDPRLFEFKQIPLELFAQQPLIEKHGIGVGDDLFIVGLFSKRWGHGRNIPIVRSGNIAAMPEEPFIDETGETYNAYLVEMRSIGGLSGSPVFAMLPPIRWANDAKTIPFKPLVWKMLFIGLVRGHWNLSSEDTAVDSMQSELDRLNTGIAQVTPADDVYALLNCQQFIDHRNLIERGELARRAPELDSGLGEIGPADDGWIQ